MKLEKDVGNLCRRGESSPSAGDPSGGYDPPKRRTTRASSCSATGRFFSSAATASNTSSDGGLSTAVAAAVQLDEDLACFSADYGHWDGVLTDCVKNVARVRPYTREHLAKLLAGNCLRFYGRRLEAAVQRVAA